MRLTGKCNCSGVTYEFNGQPEVAGFCHCKTCQRQAGGPGSFFVLVDEAGLEINDKAGKIYDTPAENGGIVHRFFCGTCGSPILSRADSLPGKAFLKAGTLDDSSALTPTIEVWCEDQLDWVPNLPAVERFQKAP